MILYMDTIFSECDYITLHATSTPETKAMINQESIAKMKDGVIIVNVARGEIIDTQALYEALLNEKIITFHPNENTATIFITIDDMFKFLDNLNYKYQIIEL